MSEMDESCKVFCGNLCFVCHLSVKETNLKRCSSCKLIYYCSESHQKIHWKDHASLCRVIQSFHGDLKQDNLRDNLNWFKYRTNLLMLCGVKLKRILKPHEVKMILFPNNCQICHKKSNLKPCFDCLSVNYCCEEHEKADAGTHKKLCHLLALCLQLDLYLEKTIVYPTYILRDQYFQLMDSMEGFIKENVILNEKADKEDLLQNALVSENLTCPLSLLYALQKINYSFKESTVVHIVGCKLLETFSLVSWEAILHIESNIQNLVIHFIGPEVKENYENSFCFSCTNKIVFEFYPCFYHDYVTSDCFKNPDVICCFNCGFHEFENSDSDTWAKSLPFLIQNKGIPLIITSFTETEASKDLEILKNVKKSLNVKTIKNKFASLRPYRDFENLGIFFNNEYTSIVLNDSL